MAGKDITEMIDEIVAEGCLKGTFPNMEIGPNAGKGKCKELADKYEGMAQGTLADLDWSKPDIKDPLTKLSHAKAICRLMGGVRQTYAMEHALGVFYLEFEAAAADNFSDPDTVYAKIHKRHPGVVDGDEAVFRLKRSGFMEGFTIWKRFALVTTYNYLGSAEWKTKLQEGYTKREEIKVKGTPRWWQGWAEQGPGGSIHIGWRGDIDFKPNSGGVSESDTEHGASGRTGYVRSTMGKDAMLHFLSPSVINYLANLNGGLTRDKKLIYKASTLSGELTWKSIKIKTPSGNAAYNLAVPLAAYRTTTRAMNWTDEGEQNHIGYGPPPVKYVDAGEWLWEVKNPGDTYWGDPGNLHGHDPNKKNMATVDLSKAMLAMAAQNTATVDWNNVNRNNKNILWSFKNQQDLWNEQIPGITWGSEFTETADARGDFNSHFDEAAAGALHKLKFTDTAFGPIERNLRTAIFDKSVSLSAAEIAEQMENIKAFFGESEKGTGDLPGTATQAAIGAAGATPKPLVSEKALKPFDYQCFLIENIKTIAGTQERASLGHYDKLITVEDTLNPGSAVSYINGGGTAAKGPREAMLSLCPDVYALLVPHIKIYRLDYPKVSGKRTPFGRPTMVPMPFSNFVSEADMSVLTTGAAGRLPGAGIKSFSWNLDGVQPAEVENNISANLTIYFQSMYDLFRYNLKGGRPQAGIPDQAGYLDLIIGSQGPASGEKNPPAPGDPHDEKGIDPCLYRHEVYDGVDFRILAVVGWSLPEGIDSIPGLEARLKKNVPKLTLTNLKDALKETRTALELQIVRHDLNFAQDGSLELSIDYQASLSGLLKTPHANIFEKTKKEKDAAKKEYQDKIDALTLGPDGKKKKLDEAETKEYDILLEQKADTERSNKIEKYHRFLEGLYESDKIYAITVDPKEFTLKTWEEMTPKERAARAKRRQSTVGEGRGYTSPTSIGTQGSAFGLVNDLANMQGSSEEQVTAALGAYTEDNKNEFKWLKENSTDLPDFISIPYFYLGDLINFVVKYTNIGGDDNNALRLALAPVELIDPLELFQVKTIKVDSKCSSGVEKTIQALAKLDPLRFRQINNITNTINIGSIPISLDAFNSWFVEHVVKPLRDDYYLLHFIKDVCTDLIGNAYSAACFGDDFLFDIRFDTATFNLAAEKPGDGWRRPKATYEQLAAGKYKVDKGTYKVANKNGPQLNITPLVLLYCTDSRPSFSNSEDQDRERGIYHYYLGASCGLLKTVNFSRSDQPYLREAKIQKKGALGAEQLRELYEVNMEMVGNTLHRNGQFFYFNPVAVGGGNPGARGTLANWARVLGFGGYFLVQKVAHTIDSSGFTVTVNGLQQAVQLEQDAGANSGLGVDLWKVEAEKSPSPSASDLLKDNPDAVSVEHAELLQHRKEAREVESETSRKSRERHEAHCQKMKARGLKIGSGCEEDRAAATTKHFEGKAAAEAFGDADAQAERLAGQEAGQEEAIARLHRVLDAHAAGEIDKDRMDFESMYYLATMEYNQKHTWNPDQAQKEYDEAIANLPNADKFLMDVGKGTLIVPGDFDDDMDN